MSSVAAIARNDFRNVRRSRILWGVVAIYVAFIALLFYASGTGTDPNVRDTLFGAVFLTTLVLPLVATAASYLSVAGERESNTIRFLLSQPASRRSVVLGKFLSRGALVTTALLVAVLVGVAFVLAFYPALEPIALAKFTGLTLLLVGAYVSVSIALSTVSASRSRAIALTMAFYFITDILSVVNAFSVKAAMEWVLGEMLGLGISAEVYEGMSTVVSPAKAYVNSTLAIFSPENFQRIQVPGELPFYLETWFMVLLLAAWIVVPLLLAVASFDRAEIA